MRTKHLLIAMLWCTFAMAQNPAAIDITYDHSDHRHKFLQRTDKSIVQADGKILVVGFWQNLQYYSDNNTGQNVPQRNLIRLNPDLTIDTSFSFDMGPNVTITDIGVQSGGKIIISGTNFRKPDGTAVGQNLVRLNTNGSYDPTFNFDGAFPDIISIRVAADNKILYRVANEVRRTVADGAQDGFSIYSNSNSFIALPNLKVLTRYGNYLERFNANGTLDNTFAFTEFDCAIDEMKLQPDGKILVNGYFASVDGFPAVGIARLNADGTVDTGFTPPTPTIGDPCQHDFRSIALQPDGKILIAGDLSVYGNPNINGVARLNASGTLDTSFTSYLTGVVQQVNVGTNGNILLALDYIPGVPARLFYSGIDVDSFIRLDGNGNLLDHGLGSQMNVYDFVVDASGKTALLGDSTFPYHRGIKLVDDEGEISLNANLFDGFDNISQDTGYENTSVFDAVVQPDGKMLVVGIFTKYNGMARSKIARLNADYSLDVTFNPGTGFSHSETSWPAQAHSVVLQPDGRILVSGQFEFYNGVAVGSVVRLNQDGTLDSTFSANTVNAGKLSLQPDGKILVAGFNAFRLNADGSLDTTFSTNQPIAEFALQPDGKIVALTDGGVIRLKPNGSQDMGFEYAFLTGAINTLALQADGKVLVGGNFIEYSGGDNSSTAFRMLRLNQNGTLDPGFDVGTGFNGSVHSIKITANGRILVGGRFTRYNGQWVNGSVRLLGGDANMLTGTVRFDAGGDGCSDTDADYPNLKLRVTSGSTTSDYIADASGHYSIALPSGTFTVTPVFENPTYQDATPANAVIVLPGGANPTVQDFCVVPNGVHNDLEAILLPLEDARPGFNASYKLVYKNKGNQTLSVNAVLSYPDATLDYISATNSPTIAPGSLSWTYNNLSPNEIWETIIVFNLNSPTETPGLNSGDVLDFEATVTSAVADETPSDNVFALHQTVVNSHDPNDKTCVEGAVIGIEKVGDYVHYVIRFENTGTFAAQNVTVRDVIDSSKYDISSLVPSVGSHAFSTRITNLNQVDFVFENINLAFDDANNDGFVSFKIKTKTTLVEGDSFSNSAAIYFDYNAPIITDVAVTTISALKTGDFANNNFLVYPNPTGNLLSVEPKTTAQLQSCEIYDMAGRLVIAVGAQSQMNAIDVSELRSGTYLIKFHCDKGTTATRFIKK